MDNGLTAADVALLNKNDDWGGNSFMWIFALLILAGGGFGGLGWGNNNFANAIGYNNLATQNDVQRGFDNMGLQDQSRDILNAVNNGTAQAVAATNQAKYDNINVMKDVQMALASQIGDVRTMEQNIMGQQSRCCCDLKQLVQGVASVTDAQIARNNYDAAMRDAATNANFTAQIQSVKDMMAQNKIEAQAQRINQLELAQATAGVLRFPNTWSYGAGPFPPVFGGCCGNNNI